ncbi:Rv3654c family TadE-like protein [Streptomyces sp. NPDC020917]|uniref:Rv3654c family TadE-like protein n=1 Tax=Streptomyces sp. NPDC020917 TaxID=3365102 RepID=UPI0037BAF5E1
MRKHGDRGSATIWSLGAMGVLLALFAAALFLSQAVIARHRAGGAADLAALAAADHALDGPQTACRLAAAVAQAQGARLRSCQVAGEVAEVVAEVDRARVRSRAGPADEPTPAAPQPRPPTTAALPPLA